MSDCNYTLLKLRVGERLKNDIRLSETYRRILMETLEKTIREFKK